MGEVKLVDQLFVTCEIVAKVLVCYM